MRTFSTLAIASLLVFPVAAHAGSWDIDTSHSTVGFTVKHMMVSTVRGSFDKVKGSIDIDDKDIAKSKVEVTIDVASVNTHDSKRDGHLKSPDFFDTAKYPTATFTSTKVEKAGKGKLKVTGDFNLRGVTKPLVLIVEGPSASLKTPFGTTVRAASATGKLNRKDYGVDWNKPLEAAAGVLVGDDVKLEINVELVERVAPATPAGEVPPKAEAPKPAHAPAK